MEPFIKGWDPDWYFARVVAFALAMLLLFAPTPVRAQPTTPTPDPATGITSWPELDRVAGTHVEGEVLYAQIPPAGGPHNPVMQNCGFYSEPIYNWHAVHSLEHGAVWITYEPGLPAGDMQILQAFGQLDHVLVSAYPGQGSPVVVSSWGRQLHLDAFDPYRVQEFVNEYRNNPATAPEPNAPCAQGTSDTVAPGGTLQVEPSVISGTPDEVATAEAEQ